MFQVIYLIIDYFVSSVVSANKSNKEATALIEAYIAQSTALKDNFESTKEAQIYAIQETKRNAENVNNILLVVLIICVIAIFIKKI